MSEIFDLVIFYLNGVLRRRWIVLIVAWAVAIPGWLVVASMPSVYQSSSRIYVDTSSVLQPLLRGIAVQTNLATQVELMKQTLLSRPNVEAVARKTDYALSATTDAEMEALLSSIQGRTTVLSTKQDVFSIVFQDTNPKRAHDVVQALLTIFVESNLGQSRKDLDTAEEFIDGQIAEYEARLEEAEDKLARFKQQHIDVASGDGSYLSRASAANYDAKELEQDLKVAIAQRDLLRQELAGIPATLPGALTNNSGPPDDTDARIIELEVRLRELLSVYTEKHPDVLSTKRQLDALLAKQEATMVALADPASDPTGPGPEAGPQSYGEPNPVYDQVKLRVIELETQIENLRQRSAAAQAVAEALAGKAEEVPQIEAEFQKLNRDYNIVKARHNELLARRESARMSRNRDDIGQQVQYRLIDPPLIPSEPIGPNRPLFLNAVAVGAIGIGLGFALVLVILDTSFSTLTELRHYTQLPVLGSIADTRRERKIIGRFAANMVLGAGFACFLLVLLVLHMIEQQFGLDAVASANLGQTLHSGVSLVIQKASDLLGWVQANLPS